MKPLSPLESFCIRTAGSVLSRSGWRGRSLLILMYHRVLAEPDPMLPDEPDAVRFAAQMDLLARNFNVLPLSEAVERLQKSSLPPRAVCITFDDGYANNLTVAAPILAARKLPATVFVATGFLDGGRMFNDTVTEAVRRAPQELDLRSIGLGSCRLEDLAARRRAVGELLGRLKYLSPEERRQQADRVAQIVGAELPRDLMMTESQVRELVRHGIEVGAHTVNHPILTRVDDSTARREMAENKSRLEDITEAPVRLFAYPNGRPGRDYSSTHVRLARETGFAAAVSTAWGAAAGAGLDRFQLPRVAPWDPTALRFSIRLGLAYRQRAAAV